MSRADYIIKNGCVIDTYNKVHAIQPIAIKNGKIADTSVYNEADQIIDATGCIVCPGLIDFHAHVAVPCCEMAVDPNIISFGTGVTTIVDAGSTGTASYEFFRKYADTTPVRIKAMLNVAPEGLATVRHPENADPKYWNREKIKELFAKYRDDLVGLKVRFDINCLNGMGVELLESAIQLAEELGCPIICHTTNPPIPMESLIGYFRSGDVFTHIYHGKGNTILDEDGNVRPQFRAAQERGVLLDASNGYKNFSNIVAKKAIDSGLFPDILSTDLIRKSAFADSGNVVSLPFIMSKYIAFGMPIDLVVKAVTETPAKRIGMLDSIGTLDVGTTADISILRIISKNVVFRDLDGNTFDGTQLIRPEMTIKDGQIMFRQIDF